MIWFTVTEYLCHTWPRICSVCHNHTPVLSSFMTYHRVLTWVTRGVPLVEQELFTLPYSTWVHTRFYFLTCLSGYYVTIKFKDAYICKKTYSAKKNAYWFFSKCYSVYGLFTAVYLYIKLIFHTLMSYKILNKELKKTVTCDKFGQYPVMLKSVSIVTTMCG